MVTIPRYAIYYAPAPDSDLERFGSHLLGYDAQSGEPLPFPAEITRHFADWPDLTRSPRKYGFHATLKAPIVLKSGKTEADLLAACESFAAKNRSTPVIKPVVSALDGFIAIVPEQPSVELERLAADCTTEFDQFRAPLTPEDRDRRNPSVLTLRQREHLDLWGYPYVMEDFRFHMTLTGHLSSDRINHILTVVQERFAALEIVKLPVDRIALFRQEAADLPFRTVRHYVLQAS
jgi:putative phosphonate metabolism protein